MSWFSHVGAKAMRFEVSLTVQSVRYKNLPMPLFLVWSRGSKSDKESRTATVPGVKGVYDFLDASGRPPAPQPPLVAECTMYEKKGKFMPKKGKLYLRYKQKSGGDELSLGVAELNISDYLDAKNPGVPVQQTITLSFLKCLDKSAVITFQLKARWMQHVDVAKLREEDPDAVSRVSGLSTFASTNGQSQLGRDDGRDDEDVDEPEDEAEAARHRARKLADDKLLEKSKMASPHAHDEEEDEAEVINLDDDPPAEEEEEEEDAAEKAARKAAKKARKEEKARKKAAKEAARRAATEDEEEEEEEEEEEIAAPTPASAATAAYASMATSAPTAPVNGSSSPPISAPSTATSSPSIAPIRNPVVTLAAPVVAPPAPVAVVAAPPPVVAPPAEPIPDDPDWTNFTGSLSFILSLQTEEDADLEIPMPLYKLIKSIKKLGGYETPSIFKLMPEPALVDAVRARIESGNYKLKTDDPHVIAATIKLWLSSIANPILPPHVHALILRAGAMDDIDPEVARLRQEEEEEEERLEREEEERNADPRYRTNKQTALADDLYSDILSGLNPTDGSGRSASRPPVESVQSVLQSVVAQLPAFHRHTLHALVVMLSKLLEPKLAKKNGHTAASLSTIFGGLLTRLQPVPGKKQYEVFLDRQFANKFIEHLIAHQEVLTLDYPNAPTALPLPTHVAAAPAPAAVPVAPAPVVVAPPVVQHDYSDILGVDGEAADAVDEAPQAVDSGVQPEEEKAQPEPAPEPEVEPEPELESVVAEEEEVAPIPEPVALVAEEEQEEEEEDEEAARRRRKKEKKERKAAKRRQRDQDESEDAQSDAASPPILALGLAPLPGFSPLRPPASTHEFSSPVDPFADLALPPSPAPASRTPPALSAVIFDQSLPTSPAHALESFAFVDEDEEEEEQPRYESRPPAAGPDDDLFGGLEEISSSTTTTTAIPLAAPVIDDGRVRELEQLLHERDQQISASEEELASLRQTQAEAIRLYQEQAAALNLEVQRWKDEAERARDAEAASAAAAATAVAAAAATASASTAGASTSPSSDAQARKLEKLQKKLQIARDENDELLEHSETLARQIELLLQISEAKSHAMTVLYEIRSELQVAAKNKSVFSAAAPAAPAAPSSSSSLTTKSIGDMSNGELAELVASIQARLVSDESARGVGDGRHLSHLSISEMDPADLLNTLSGPYDEAESSAAPSSRTVATLGLHVKRAARERKLSSSISNVTASLASKDQDIRRLQQQLHDAQESLAWAQHAAEEQAALVEEAEANLATERAAAKEGAASHASLRTDLEAQVDESSRRLVAAESSRAAMKKDAEKAHARVLALEAQVAIELPALQTQLATLQATHDELRENHETLEEEHTVLQDQLRSSIRKVKELVTANEKRVALAAAAAAAAAAATSSPSKRRSDADSSDEESSATSRRRRKIGASGLSPSSQAEILSFKQIIADKNSLIEEHEATEARLLEKIESLEQERADLTSKASAAAIASATALEQSQQHTTELTASLQALERELADVQRQTNALIMSPRNRPRSTNDDASSEAEEELRAHIIELDLAIQAHVSQINTLQEENTDLQAQVDRLATAPRSSPANSQRDSQPKSSSNGDSPHEMATQVQALQHQLDAATEMHALKLSEQEAKSAREIAILQNFKAALGATYTQLEAETIQLRERELKFNSLNDALDRKYLDPAAKKKLERKELTLLQALQEQQRRTTFLEAQVRQCDETINITKETYVATNVVLEQELDGIESENENLRELYAELKIQLQHALQQQSTSPSEDSDDPTSKYAVHAITIDWARYEHVKLALTSAETVNGELAAELAHVRQSLDATREEFAAGKKSLQEAQKEILVLKDDLVRTGISLKTIAHQNFELNEFIREHSKKK